MKRIAFFLILFLFVSAIAAFGAEPGAAGEEAHGGGHLSISSFLFAIVLVLLAAKLGGELFERLNQPAVLGELVFGMLLGNLHLVGITALDWFKTSEGLAVAAEIGVILLVFEVGLESNIDELLAVGASAMIVAVLGVIAPMILGYGVSIWFLPDAGWYVHLFAGATLAATSVGITARVLKDLKQMETKEARIILGAAG
jgi:Kef-type K+ transport system membrane component KefB